MTNLSYFIHLIILYFIRIVCFFIPKKQNLILFSSWFGQKYADSSKFMYEYLLSRGNYCVKWYTVNKSLYNEMKSNELPVVYGKSFSGIWNQVRAKMLVSSIQLSDYNHFFIHNCVFFDLDHGFALKQVGFAIPGYDKNNYKYNMAIRKGIDFWMSASTSWSMDKISTCYKVNPNHIVRCNKPRTDVLFDSSLRKGLNTIVDGLKNGRKAIVWMPTHRSCGEVPMFAKQLFDLESIQKLCEERDFIFIIKKHFYHKNENEDLSLYPNIFDLTSENLDSQVILSQADVLVSDYSSSYMEYLILDRPIILYAYDIEDYLAKERGLYIKLEDNTAGEVVTTKEGFVNSLRRVSEDWYDSRYAPGRKKARELYFDNSIHVGEYRSHVARIIRDLIEGTYTPKWND